MGNKSAGVNLAVRYIGSDTAISSLDGMFTGILKISERVIMLWQKSGEQ